MSILLILPSETAILSRRRADDPDDKTPIMHALDSDVFHYCCRYTDWTTGRIGELSALSYARIALALTEDIPRKPNRSLRQVTRRCVRNSVERLIKARLFLRQSTSVRSGIDKNRLLLDRVFWVALLRTEETDSNIDSRQLAGLMQQLLKNKPFNNSVLREFYENGSEGRYSPVSTYKSIYLSKAKNTPFRLSLTWQPDRKQVDLFLKTSGFSGDQIEKVWFGKYVQYWSTQTIARTQREWSEHFANHMQSYLLRPGYFEEKNGIGFVGTQSESQSSTTKVL